MFFGATGSPMYVCLCKSITDSQIRDAAHRGCTGLRELRRELGVGSQCAKCVRQAREVLRESQAGNQAPAAVMFWPQPA